MLFEALVNSLEAAIILFNKKAVITFINKTGEEFVGKGSKELIGRRFKELFPEEKVVSRLIKKTISEGRSFSGREVDINIGRTANVDFNLSPFFLDGENEGSLLSLRENIAIAEREDYSFDSLVYLLGSIAHEIKNPLGGIKGAAQLLRDKVKDKNSTEYISLIVRETDRLNSVLQDYLTISRKPVLHQVNIHEVIEKAISIMNIPLKNGKIPIHRLYDPSLPRVSGDEGKLLQVFLNIIKNAIEAMPRGGRLSITTKPSSEYVMQRGKIRRWAVTSIEDTGKGIPQDELQKIFLPFYTKKKRGTGLGLALSKKIIKDHNGFIKVESPHQANRGTTFQIYIPFEE